MVGKFIVFEGIDGCGKGTQLKKLAAYLFDKEKRNIVLLTREPTGISPAGQELRRCLANDKNPKENANIYTRLFIEDRNYHIKNIITPALEAGITVLCDRYKYSTIIYQTAQGGKEDTLLELHKGMPIPDVVFVIDIPAKTALERMKRKTDVFEKEEFLSELKGGYKNLPKLFPNEDIITIDGTETPEKVHQAVIHEIEKKVKN